MKKGVVLLCLAMGVFFLAEAQDAPADSTLKHYAGKYKFPEGSVIAEVTVALENGALTMTSSAGVSALEKQSDDLYTIVSFAGTAKFNRDANRKITGVTINARGYLLEGVKEEAALGFHRQLSARTPLLPFIR